jgi:hypothetical protein
VSAVLAALSELPAESSVASPVEAESPEPHPANKEETIAAQSKTLTIFFFISFPLPFIIDKQLL